MDNSSNSWFTLDVAGDKTVARGADANDKSSQDLERLVFGDNISRRIKSPDSRVVAEPKKFSFKNEAPKPISTQKNKKNRPPSRTVPSDDGESSSVPDNMSASSEVDARNDEGNLTANYVRLRAPAWQDEDDDAIQACAKWPVEVATLTLAFRWTFRASPAPKSCGKMNLRQLSVVPNIRCGCASNLPSCMVPRAGQSPRLPIVKATAVRMVSKSFSAKAVPFSTKVAPIHCDAEQLTFCVALTQMLLIQTLQWFKA